MMSARVTIKDIAKKIGCSFSAVSLALQNSPKISAALTKRIHAEAKRSGYRPDPWMSALSEYRKSGQKRAFKSKVLFVYNETFPEANPEVSSWVNKSFVAAQEEGDRLGYLVEVLKMPQAPEKRAQILKVMRYQGVNGFIFIHYHFDSEELASPYYEKTALVNLMGEVVHSDIPTVDINQDRAMSVAFQKVLAKGYQRIGFVYIENTKNHHPHNLIRTYLYESYRHSLLQSVPILALSDESNQEELLAWVKKNRVEVVISRGGAEFYPMVEACQKKEKRKLGYVGLEVLDPTSGCSGVLECRTLVGVLSMREIHRQLTSQLFSPMPHPSLTLIAPEWSEGSTY